jgi:AcrR family transcriptional regulator
MTTRDEILASAYRLLYRGGFARVSMDDIARAAHVTKRTIYYHFDSKDALTAAVLEQQHEHALAQVRGWGASAETPALYLAALFAALEAWARRPRWLGSGFTRLSVELAHLPGHPARRAARRHKREVEDWVRGELDRLRAGHADELACRVLILIEGAMSLAVIHGDVGYIAVAGRIAVELAGEDA